jgi:MraZ protein
VFQGSAEHLLDDKGRTSLPKSFRDVLEREERSPIITCGERCLTIYTSEAYEGIKARLFEDPLPSAQIKRKRRLIVGNAQECRVDAQGRILIPPPLRKLGKLEREIVFAGIEDQIEIWDRSLWQEELERARLEDE